MLAALSRRWRWRMGTLGTLVAAGLVAGSPSSIAPVVPGPALATTTTSLGHHTGGIPPDGSPGPSLRSAGPFFLTVLAQKISGNWAKAWQSLYPLHQRIAPRDTFVRCEAATPFPAPLESIHVVRVRAVPVHVPGVLRPVPGAAITVAVALTWYGPRDPITFSYTFHLAAVHGRWTWLLSLDRYGRYSEHGCVAGGAL